jgi:hypothetical protein
VAFVVGSAHARFVSEPAVHPRRLSACRLACVRGDIGFLRDVLPHLDAEDAVLGQPRLIHFAIYGGPAVLELLADHGRLELEARDGAGRTPLMLAAALPKHGPAGASSEELEVPLSEIVAAHSCRWLLTAGAEVEARDPQGFTALHWAAHAGRPMCVAALIEAGANVDVLDHRGRTPLMLALLERGEAAGEKSIDLLLRAGADADIRDDHGWTCLHHLAAGGSSNQRVLAQQLFARGARPSRDRAGRSPADLSKCWQASHRDGWQVRRTLEGDPLDVRTPVAAGPGPYRLPTEPTLANRLLDQLVPAQLDPSPGNPAPRRTRAELDEWRVWADWLQSRGDVRGELVSTSLACVGLGARKRRRMLEMLAHVGLRTYSASHAGLHCADALAPARATPLELRWRHGFLTAATIRAPLPQLDPTQVPEIATALLESEPLLAELRIHLVDDALWPELISTLARMQPCPRLRRLVLQGLPMTLPNFDELPRTLPAVRSLGLIGRWKINSARVCWPGLTHLRLRHGGISQWTPGQFDLTLELPDLTHLDLALPIGRGGYEQQEIHRARTILDALERVEHLRLAPLDSHFARLLLASPRIGRLRTLELVNVHEPALEVVLASAEVLRELERVRVQLRSRVEPPSAGLERLRQALPNLELGLANPGRRRPFAVWNHGFFGDR